MQEEGERQQEALEAQIDKAQAAVDHSVQDASAVVLDSRQLVRGESEQPLRLTLAAQQRPSSMQWHRGPPKGGSVLDLGAAGPSVGSCPDLSTAALHISPSSHPHVFLFIANGHRCLYQEDQGATA